jgi:ABC-2 type transport system ATP-binding protein
VIAIEHVTKLYNRTPALRDVTLHVARGDVLGVLGPNGSGKTTLLRLLTGALSPTVGRLMVAGFDTMRQPMEARRRIGYVPEALPLYPHMRVCEFLTFMGRLRGLSPGATAAALARVSDQVHLQEVLTAPIRTLSRGYRQRVAIAQALVHAPDVLILDEPTNGLDPRQIMETRHVLRSLAGACTMVMSSHILSEVERTADRVAILLQGQLLAVRALADTPDLEALFLSLT